MLLLVLRLPAARKKVETELGQAQLQIEKRLVPQGEGVTRHLALPPTGHTAEWIFEEMAKMDKESECHADWRQGKISGAVYRAYIRTLMALPSLVENTYLLQTAETTSARSSSLRSNATASRILCILTCSLLSERWKRKS